MSWESRDGVGRFGVRAGVNMGLGVFVSLEDDEESRHCDWKRLFSSSEDPSSVSTFSLSLFEGLVVPGRQSPEYSTRCMSSSNSELLSSEAVWYVSLAGRLKRKPPNGLLSPSETELERIEETPQDSESTSSSDPALEQRPTHFVSGQSRFIPESGSDQTHRLGKYRNTYSRHLLY